MNLVNSYDQVNDRIVIILESGLIEKYTQNLKRMTKTTKLSLPQDIQVDRTGSKEVHISFPRPFGSRMESRGNMTTISLSSPEVLNVNTLINKFISLGLREELRVTEFLPLSEYPLEKLQEDVKEGIKMGRRFCVIPSYTEYQKKSGIGRYEFTQYLSYPGEEDYAEIAILINSGDLLGLSDLVKPKMTYTEWV